VPRGRIEQICNGVDTGRFRPAASGRAAMLEAGFRGHDHWLVGTVGRMESVKDQTNLARAFVLAVQARPAARARMRLVFVGDGTLRRAVEAILDQAGMRDLAWFAGERADVLGLLQGLDCFVLPSLAEGVSNTLLEAMACGLPAVATRVGANGELVDEGVTGATVPAADSPALAQAILHYFDHPALAVEHGRAARARAQQQFSLERMVDRYHDLYSRLLQPSAAATATPALVRGNHPHA